MVHEIVVPLFVLEKHVPGLGNYNQSSSIFGETTGMKCSCNALVTIFGQNFLKYHVGIVFWLYVRFRW